MENVPETPSPVQPTRSKRVLTIVLVMLRYSLLAFLLLVIVATALTYRRSYTKADRLQIKLYDNRCLVLGAREGGAMIGIFDYKKFLRKPPNEIARAHYYVVDVYNRDEPFLEEIMPSTNQFGLGIVNQISYEYEFSKIPLHMSMRSYRPDLWRLTGTGIIFLTGWHCLSAVHSLPCSGSVANSPCAI